MKITKSIVFLCSMSAVLISGISASAQSVQQGVTLEYKGKEAKLPLAGVSVAAANAGAVMSDHEGRFTLNFRTLREGDQIQLRRIEMNGYEVMNTEALEVARVARVSKDAQAADNATLRIVMAPRQLLNQLRDGYRSVATQRYQKELKAAEAEAERLRQQGKLAEEEYNARMDALEEEYQQKLTSLETYIDKFARIDLSDLEADEQQIVTLVQAGEFDEALAIYDHQDLANRLRQSRADRQKLVDAREQIAAAERQKAAENLRLRQSIDRQVTLLRMAGGQDNLQKAYRIVHETFLADTTDWEARRDYAMSLFEQGMSDASVLVLQTGIATNADAYAQGMMSLDLMDVNWNAEAYEQAYAYAQQAEELLWPLRQGNYTVLSRALPAFSAIELQYLQNVAQDNERCKAIVSRVNQHWSPDSLSCNSLISYVALLSVMGDYYSRTLDHQQSLWTADQSIRLGECLHYRFPARSTLNNAYSSACMTYATEGHETEVLATARKCATLWQEYCQKGVSNLRISEAAYDFYSLTEALTTIGNYAAADSIIHIEQALRIFAQFEDKYPGLMPECSACYRLSQVSVLLYNGRIDEAETVAHEAFALLQQSESPIHSYLQPYYTGRIRQAQQRYSEADRYYQEAIGVCESQYAADHDAWMADNLCRYYLQLAEVKAASGDRKACQKALKHAERMAVFESDRQLVERTKQKIQQ